KLSVPAALQVWPGVSPWTTGSAGAVEHAMSRAGTSRAKLRIDRLLRRDSAHLQLAVHDRKGESPFDEINSILAEFLVPPAGEDVEVIANARRERLEVVRAGNQAGGDPGLLRADFEQKLEQVAHQHPVLGQPRAPGIPIGHLIMLERLGCLEGGDQPSADVVVAPPGGQTPNSSEVVLVLGRMEDDLGKSIVLDD